MTLNDADLARLAEIEQRISAATEGPWYDAYCGIFSLPITQRAAALERELPDDATDEQWNAIPEPIVGWVPAMYGDTPGPQAAADARFMAEARDDLPWLIGLVRSLAGGTSPPA